MVYAATESHAIGFTHDKAVDPAFSACTWEWTYSLETVSATDGMPVSNFMNFETSSSPHSLVINPATLTQLVQAQVDNVYTFDLVATLTETLGGSQADVFKQRISFTVID